mgnify:CR=1 FL=1
MGLYLNGNSAGSISFTTADLMNTTSDLEIGAFFEGILDEFRFWTKGKSPSEANQDFSRLMNGGESNLAVYLKMNEGMGDYTYDFSRTTLTDFNKNHARFIGGPSW